MWEIILRYLSIFGWILGGAIILWSIIVGTLGAIDKVFGRSLIKSTWIDFESVFGFARIVVFVVANGVGWGIIGLIFGEGANEKFGTNISLIAGIAGGIVVTTVATIVASLKTWSFLSDDDNPFGLVNAIVGLIAGLIVGGIYGWIGGGVGGLIGGVILGVLGLYFCCESWLHF